MSPAQLSLDSGVEGKDVSSTPLDSEIDSGLTPPEKENNCRYSTRSKPRTYTTDATKEEGRGIKRKRNSRSDSKVRSKKFTKWEENSSNATHEVPVEEPNNKEGTCPICEETFTDLHSFTVHIKQHNSDNTICGICSRKLSSPSSLDRHMLTHTGFKPFNCSVCSVSFTTNGNMNRHMHIHYPKRDELKRDVKTLEDEDVKTSADDMNVKITPKEVFLTQASICYSDKDNIESKITDYNDPSIVESTKYTVGNTEESLEKSKSRLKEQSNSASFSDPKVITGFQDLSYIAFSTEKFSLVAKKVCEETIRLSNSPEKSYNCHFCERAFPCVISRKKHELHHTSSRGTVCHTCPCYFDSPDLLQEHVMQYHHHSNPINDLSSSNESFTFMAALGLHQKSKKAVLSPNEKPQVGEIENIIVPQSFVSESNTNTGQTESIKELEKANYFPCSKKKKMMNSTAKRDHKSANKRIEEGKGTGSTIGKENDPSSQDTISCNIIKSEINLNIGSIVVETALPETNPEQNCHQESSNDFADIPSILSNLAATPGTSSEENIDSFEAPHVENNNLMDSFRVQNPKNLKKGPKKLHLKFKKLYSCTLCHYKSTEKSSMLRHMITHNKQRPFKCTLCQLTFTTKSNGERHAGKKHKLPKHELATVIDYNLKVSNSEGEENACKYCRQLFKNSRSLQHHLRSVNKSCNKKPFICRECNRGCSTKNNCIRHIQNKHGELLNNPSTKKAETKIGDFIVVNKDKKTTEQQNEQISASDAEAGGSIYESSNCETSSSDAPSPLPQQNLQQENLFNDDERVNVAVILSSLSATAGPVIQQSPLDLSVRALDLSENKNILPLEKHTANTFHESCSSFSDPSFNISSSLSHNPTTSRDVESVAFPNYSTPLNLTRTQNCFPDLPASFTPIAHHPSSREIGNGVNSVCLEPQQKMPKSKILYRCNYCGGTFTQKSNKDRHVRKFHPEHAKPRRNKNYAPSSPGRNVPKQSTSTLSHTTREALLTRVLQHSDNNKQQSEEEVRHDHSLDTVIKEEPSQAEEGMHSDLENVDLASVSSVINTANSPQFTQYLTEDMNSNVFTPSETGRTAEEPAKIKMSKAANEKPLSCDKCSKTFNCKSSLRRHSVTHTGERPFGCHKCRARFTTNSNLVRHLAAKHKAKSLHPFKSSPSYLESSSESFLHEVGFKHEQTLAKACFSPATGREYPEPNRSPTLPEISQAAIPSTSRQSMSLECSVCSTTYKTEYDLWNHMKELHHLEYERMHGKNVNVPDIVSLWKKNGCAKLKR